MHSVYAVLRIPSLSAQQQPHQPWRRSFRRSTISPQLGAAPAARGPRENPTVIERGGFRPGLLPWVGRLEQTLKLMTVAVVLAVQALAVGPTATPADAADPPNSWTNERILDCDGHTVVGYLTPAGFGSAFHVSGSTDVIKPKHVEVIFPDMTQPVVTADVPGFEDKARTVHCTYTDPAGLFVHFIGLRN